MRRVILVTRDYTEIAKPAGLCAAAFADLYAGLGWRIHVVCATSPAPQPRHVTNGRTDVHRIDLQRNTTEASFALHACRRVYELTSARRTDMVACIDAPSAIPAVATLRHLGSDIGTILDVVVDPRRGGPDTASAADARLLLTEPSHAPQPREHVIPCPIAPHTWTPPTTTAPTVIVPDPPAADDHTAIVDAFRAADIMPLGWSLAIMGHHGRWTIMSGDERAAAAHDSRADLIIARGIAEPIAAVIGTTRHHLPLVEERSPLAGRLPATARDQIFGRAAGRSIAECLGHAATMTAAERAARIDAIRDAIIPRHEPTAIAAAHLRLLTVAPNSPDTAIRLAMWQAAERSAAADPHMPEIAHR